MYELTMWSEAEECNEEREVIGDMIFGGAQVMKFKTIDEVTDYFYSLKKDALALDKHDDRDLILCRYRENNYLVTENFMLQKVGMLIIL